LLKKIFGSFTAGQQMKKRVLITLQEMFNFSLVSKA